MAAQPHQGSASQYDVFAQRNVFIPARDGVKLATDIYHPALAGRPLPGPWPVILERTPYLKERTRYFRKGSFYARHGYVMAIQDVRGRGESEGDWYPFAREAPDGYDAVEWLAGQPWSTGRIGTIGTSYAAAVQSALAALNPPHLAAQFIAMGPHNYRQSSMRHNGCLEQRFLLYAFMMARTSKEARRDPVVKAAFDRAAQDIAAWAKRFPLRKGRSPLALIPTLEEWVLDIQNRGDDDDYWGQPSLAIDKHYQDQADVPTVFFGGWYDSYARSTPANFVALSEIKKSPQFLVMGPWTHGDQTCEVSVSGEVDFGPEAALDQYHRLPLRFFDTFLKDLDTGLRDEPRVSYFLMGGGDHRRDSEDLVRRGGAWKSENTWPPEGTTLVPYHLRADGALSPEGPDEDLAASSFRFDPANPVPTVGGCISVGLPLMTNGGWDQRGWPLGSNPKYSPYQRFEVFSSQDRLPLSARPDVLTFQTPPLEKALTIAGPIEVILWVSSTSVDTDFTLKLVDVAPPNPDFPDGLDLLVTDSIQRCRYREDRPRPKLMEPGQIYRLAFQLYPTAVHFAAGHRLRVDVSSSNWPRFDLNPNTGEPLGLHTRTEIAVNSIHHGPEQPSHIVLPVQQVPEG